MAIKILPMTANTVTIEAENGDRYRISDSEDLGLTIIFLPDRDMIVEDWRLEEVCFKAHGIRINNQLRSKP